MLTLAVPESSIPISPRQWNGSPVLKMEVPRSVSSGAGHFYFTVSISDSWPVRNHN